MHTRMRMALQQRSAATPAHHKPPCRRLLAAVPRRAAAAALCARVLAAASQPAELQPAAHDSSDLSGSESSSDSWEHLLLPSSPAPARPGLFWDSLSDEWQTGASAEQLEALEGLKSVASAAGGQFVSPPFH